MFNITKKIILLSFASIVFFALNLSALVLDGTDKVISLEGSLSGHVAELHYLEHKKLRLELIRLADEKTVGFAELELNIKWPMKSFVSANDAGKLQTLFVRNFRTLEAPSMAGKTLMVLIAKLAESENLPIVLEAAYGSSFFWAKMGFVEPTPADLVNYRPQGLRGPVEKILSIKKYLDELSWALEKALPSTMDGYLVLPEAIKKTWAEMSLSDLAVQNFPKLPYADIYLSLGAEADMAIKTQKLLEACKKRK